MIFLDGDLDVKDICYHVDEEMQLWAGVPSNMKKHVWRDVHFATVDTIKLLNVSICNKTCILTDVQSIC